MGEKKPRGQKRLVSRREFLIGSGAVIAAGALMGCTPTPIGARSKHARRLFLS